MGVGGRPFLFKKADMLRAIEKHNGVIMRIAKEFGVDRSTIHTKFREDVDFQQALSKARKEYVEVLLDKSESALEMALDRCEEDMNNALKSAFYYLNNLGRDRGYSPPTQTAIPVDPEYIKRFEECMKTVADNQIKKAQSTCKE